MIDVTDIACRQPCLPEEQEEMCLGCALAFFLPDEEPEATEPERSEAA